MFVIIYESLEESQDIYESSNMFKTVLSHFRVRAPIQYRDAVLPVYEIPLWR